MKCERTLMGKGIGGNGPLETKVMRTGPLTKCIFPLSHGTVTLSPVICKSIRLDKLTN